MKTTKPLSTISYNSYNFLLGKLQDLTTNGFIRFFVFIEHKPEEDEKKSHFHVYIEPAKQIDDNWIRSQFNEAHPDGILKCLPFNKTKFADWYWYDLHDKAYLALKGQSRKYHYTPDCMVTDEPEYLAELVRVNPRPMNDIDKVLSMLDKGLLPLEIARQMNIPLTRLSYAVGAIGGILKYRDTLDRNGADNHEVEYIENEDF